MPEIEHYTFSALGDLVTHLRGQENKEYFRSIFNNYLSNYKFNELLFAEENIKPLI